MYFVQVLFQEIFKWNFSFQHFSRCLKRDHMQWLLVSSWSWWQPLSSFLLASRPSSLCPPPFPSPLCFFSFISPFLTIPFPRLISSLISSFSNEVSNTFNPNFVSHELLIMLVAFTFVVIQIKLLDFYS